MSRLASGGALDEIPAQQEGETWFLPGITFVQDRDITSSRKAWMESRFDHYAFGSSDRYQRRAVWPLDKDGSSLQAGLIEQGQVLYSGLPGAWRQQLLKAEQTARRYRRGIWKAPVFLHQASELPLQSWQRLLGRFVVVEGVITATGKGQQFQYLNFGGDWKTDFSVSLPKSAGDMSGLVGQKLSVRGWLEKRNGPSLDLLSADWLIMLEQ